MLFHYESVSKSDNICFFLKHHKFMKNFKLDSYILTKIYMYYFEVFLPTKLQAQQQHISSNSKNNSQIGPATGHNSSCTYSQRAIILCSKLCFSATFRSDDDCFAAKYTYSIMYNNGIQAGFDSSFGLISKIQARTIHTV